MFGEAAGDLGPLADNLDSGCELEFLDGVLQPLRPPNGALQEHDAFGEAPAVKSQDQSGDTSTRTEIKQSRDGMMSRRIGPGIVGVVR
jgi:hypothetical protein